MWSFRMAVILWEVHLLVGHDLALGTTLALPCTGVCILVLPLAFSYVKCSAVIHMQLDVFGFMAILAVQYSLDAWSVSGQSPAVDMVDSFSTP